MTILSALIPNIIYSMASSQAARLLPGLTGLRATPAVHLLNRISYGARPEEVQRVEQLGVAAYIDEQLAPQQIPDEEANQHLTAWPLLNLERTRLYTVGNDTYRVWLSLLAEKLLRAVYSRRQLLETMVDFWTDHFNVPAQDRPVEVLLFQREVIRQHSLGKFSTLLLATAQSPAMLTYLDNHVNYAEHPNENYARELLELHTLGVDGGYTEQDVKETARALTGWMTHDGTRDGFFFAHWAHDDGPKAILGHHFPAGRGIEDGLHVLRILAEHPQTAHFICTKLARKLVRDDPPQGLIDQMVRAWQTSNGDIPVVLRSLFASDVFWQSSGLKYRRPFAFLAAALRATGTEFTENWVMEEMLNNLGQTPYAWLPPNGYPDTYTAWLSTGGLLARWNAAQDLTHRAASEGYTGMRSRLFRLLPETATAGQLVDAAARQVFGQVAGDPLREEAVRFVSDGKGEDTLADGMLRARKLAGLFALLLSSPAFQWI